MSRGRGKSARTWDLIRAAKTILAEIQPTTIRSVCYQLFTKNIIASMKKTETNKVSVQLTWARENGVIPWHWIVDETREPERVNAWDNPAQYVESVKRSYRRDRWSDQPDRVEIWSEKGTVRGTLAPVLEEYGVTFRVMHGYGSATAIKQAADDSISSEKPLTVFYVGDWDPSGLHMSEVDLPTRLRDYGGECSLFRLALQSSDVNANNLPSFDVETKRGDTRYAWYRQHYGPRCWELDAMSPVDLRNRVENFIVDMLDLDAWRRAEVAEAAERESLLTILNAWPGISGQAKKYSPEAS